MGYRIGIDAGSKTIKLVVLDDAGDLAFHVYQRHRSNIRRTLVQLIEDFTDRYGNVEGSVAVTGSAGIAVAQMLGLPFVQEVIATTAAVRERVAQVDAIVELGGEDAKVVYLTGKPEQRMNATCAGGTGGFIDTMSGMLGVRGAEINQLAARATHIYPIASRCAVFAQTDVRPLLAAGVSKEDVAASALEAVVRQTLGGLACGRPLRGTVVFLGGPFEYIPELARRFRLALSLDEEHGVRPKNAHLFTACGAALEGGLLAEGGSGNVLSLARIGQMVVEREFPDEGAAYLEPLFSDAGERSAFERRHAADRYPRERIFNCSGPLYLGFDAGSTTVKYAVLDEDGKLVLSDYRNADGNVLETALVMLSELYKLLKPGSRLYLAQACVVGYGDEMLRTALRIDSDSVETTAHLRAAQELRPDASFVLDIGGQDMKAMWTRNGQLADAILNEACSSGCGSFVEGTARTLRMTRTEFSSAALSARKPFDLGTKCTVFTNSRVRHAQKTGAEPADIAAGIAYSVVLNALYRVIGRDKAAEMGSSVVVQGGAFKSDAVLRAFEKVTGADVCRPDTAHLMGAIGAALIARDRARALQAQHGEGAYVVSNIVTADELAHLTPRYASLRCAGCANACTLSLVAFGNGNSFVSGNRCNRGVELAEATLEERGFDALAAEGGSTLPRARKHRRRRNRTEARFNPLYHATAASIGQGAVGSKRVRAGEDAGMAADASAAASDAGAASAAADAGAAQAAAKATSLPNVAANGADRADAGASENTASTPPASNAASASDAAPARRTQGVRIVPPKHVPFDSGESAADFLAQTQHISLTNLYYFDRRKKKAEEKARASEEQTPAQDAQGMGKHPVFAELSPAHAADDVPNVVAYMQERLAAYGNRKPATRAQVVGLPGTLSAYEQAPFWHTLLSELGFGITVPSAARTAAVRHAASESVPSESVCEPAKITHARLFALRDAGATAVLLPRYERGARCPVMCGYTDALLDNVEFLRDGSVQAVVPQLRPTNPRKIAGNNEQATAVFEALRDLDADAPITRAEFDAALAAACAEYERFEEDMQARTEDALAWIAAQPQRSGIVVAGRPYHTDPALMHGIDAVIARLGLAVIPAFGLQDACAGIPVSTGWKPAKHLLRLARYCLGNPALDMVVLQSFGCGYDAITLGDVRELLTSAGRTFTALKIDEIVDTAHIRIRLRTMAEAIEARRRAESAKPTTPRASEAPQQLSSPTDIPSEHPAQALLAQGISEQDLATARSSVPADICFTAAALTAHAINVVRNGNGGSADAPCGLRVPQVCQGCMVDALPHLVQRATGTMPDVAWEHAETAQLAAPPMPAPAQPVRIGIVGNPLLCFDGYMNEHLADLLATLGAQPVMPDPAKLYVDDVRYLEQLDAFAAQGVDAVLYLQSFGCLKGHMQARGYANSIAERYPHMPVTILDYDPESSALNRENRIRLAVAAAIRAARGRTA